MRNLGLGVGLHRLRKAVGGVSVTINGLTGGIAIIGDHASLTMSVSEGTISARKWGSTYGGSEYGTGTSPTDYTAGDEGALYATATVDGTDYTTSALIQYTAPVAAGGIADQNWTENVAISTLDVSADFTASGETYALAPSSGALPTGLSLSAAGSITGTPTEVVAGRSIVVRATNSGGTADTGFSVTVAAAVSGDVEFGSLTLTGDGGAPLAEADGTYGQFTVASGEVVGNTSPLATGDTVIGASTVSVVAGYYSAKADQTEIEAAAAVAGSGDTIIVRDGTATGNRVSLTSLDFSPSGLTIKGENADQPTNSNRYLTTKYDNHGTTLPGFDLTSATGITLQDMKMTRARDGGDTPGQDAYIVTCTSGTDLHVVNCHISSTSLATFTPWISQPELLIGVGGLACTTISAKNSYFHDLSLAYKTNAGLGSEFEYNRVLNCWGSFGLQQGIAGDSTSAAGFKWNYNRCEGVWSHGGGNTAVGPNNQNTSVWQLLYDNQTANFTVGQTLTGTTSGATATIISDSDGGTAGLLYLVGPNYADTPAGIGFLNNEAITDGAGGAAVANFPEYVLPSRWKIDYDAETSPFSVGETITGGTSAATAMITHVTDNGTTGTLYLDGPAYSSVTTGNGFQDNETITGSSGGSATTDGLEAGTFPYDYGDPHGSLHGTGGAHNGFEMIGNIMLARPDLRRTAFAGTAGEYDGTGSGPKWNDPTSTSVAGFKNVTIKHNIFQPTDNVGIQIAYMVDSEYAFNTMFADQAEIPDGTPSVNIQEMSTGNSIHHNVSPGYATASGTVGSIALDSSLFTSSHENIVAMPVGMNSVESGWAMEYSQMFDGLSFSNLTADTIAAALAIKTSGILDQTVKIGATAYFDFTTNTESTIPAWTKPITATATGVRNDMVTFEVGDYTRATTFPTFSNTDEFTISIGLEMAAASSDNSLYSILLGSNSTYYLRRVGSLYGHNYLELYMKGSGSSGYHSIVKTFLTMKKSDGFQIWTFSVKQSTGQVRVMKGTTLDPFVRLNTLTDEPLIAASPNHDVGYFEGHVEFVYMSDEFIDLHDQTALDKVVSLDGNHPTYGADGSTMTGTQPEVYLTGNAAAWNAGGGLNLGSDANKYVMTGGAVTDYSATASAGLLETGDTILLETGDRLLLEA